MPWRLCNHRFVCTCQHLPPSVSVLLAVTALVVDPDARTHVRKCESFDRRCVGVLLSRCLAVRAFLTCFIAHAVWPELLPTPIAAMFGGTNCVSFAGRGASAASKEENARAASKVSYADRIRAMCAIVGLGSIGAGDLAPGAMLAATTAVRNGSAFQRTPYADEIASYLPK